jgi:hypothetical protein
VVGLRTDFRQQADDGALNLMLSQSCVRIFNPRPDCAIDDMIRLMRHCLNSCVAGAV